MNNEITEILPKRRLFDLKLGEIWLYHDLVLLFVKRDFKTSYKQTVLGPIWIILKPFMSTFVFTVIFGMIAGISTDGVPKFLFYMAGNILWSYFSSCLNYGASTFLSNARLFGKVYFPRLIMPCAGIIYNSIGFLINFVMFILLTVVYLFVGSPIKPNLCILLVPLILIITALLGTGFGLIVTSITAKYRDLGVLVSFCVTLWMYVTPVVYPVSQVAERFRPLVLLNPVAPLVETFRYAFLGSGTFPLPYLLISVAVTGAVVMLGIVVFNKVEKNFIDTI